MSIQQMRYAPCPFCHVQEAVMCCDEDADKWSVLCLNCLARGPECDSESIAEFAWNEKAPIRPAEAY